VPTETPLRERLEVKSPSEAISYLNLLIYGAPGVGKTYLGGTAQDHPDTSPVLFLDVEGGTTTLRHRKDIDVVPIKSADRLNEVYEMVVMDTEGYYKTIVLDSLTELHTLIMKAVLRQRHDKRPDLDDEPPGMKEWGLASDKLRNVVRGFRDLPCNTIIMALDKSDKDENGRVSITPALPGQLATSIPGFLDIVGYMTANEEEEEGIVRRLQTQKTRKVIAKDRTGLLDSVIESPSIPMIFECLTDDDGE
jgi:phage nucleotide-binding protein